MGVSGHFALCCTTGLVGRAPSDPTRLTILARTARRRVRKPSLTRRNYLSLRGVRITLAGSRRIRWASPMLFAMRYVVHATDLSGVALAAYEIESGCDDDAMRRAEIFLEAHPSIEIWDGVRRVARLTRAEAEIREQLAKAHQAEVTDHEVKPRQKV